MGTISHQWQVMPIGPARLRLYFNDPGGGGSKCLFGGWAPRHYPLPLGGVCTRGPDRGPDPNPDIPGHGPEVGTQGTQGTQK